MEIRSIKKTETIVQKMGAESMKEFIVDSVEALSLSEVCPDEDILQDFHQEKSIDNSWFLEEEPIDSVRHMIGTYQRALRLYSYGITALTVVRGDGESIYPGRPLFLGRALESYVAAKRIRNPTATVCV